MGRAEIVDTVSLEEVELGIDAAAIAKSEVVLDDTLALTDDVADGIEESLAEDDESASEPTLMADQSSLLTATGAALEELVQETAFSRYSTSLAVMTSLPLIQILNPPSLRPGVFSQTSCRIVVQSPSANVHAPRPMERPYCESQTD